MSCGRYVSYEEYPRDEQKFPGNTEEVYPDYIIGWFLVVNPGTSKRIVEASKVPRYVLLYNNMGVNSELQSLEISYVL